MAPPNKRNFSVSVVFPASGWEIIAKVLRLVISLLYLFDIIGRKCTSIRLFFTPGKDPENLFSGSSAKDPRNSFPDRQPYRPDIFRKLQPDRSRNIQPQKSQAPQKKPKQSLIAVKSQITDHIASRAQEQRV